MKYISTQTTYWDKGIWGFTNKPLFINAILPKHILKVYYNWGLKQLQHVFQSDGYTLGSSMAVYGHEGQHMKSTYMSL